MARIDEDIRQPDPRYDAPPPQPAASPPVPPEQPDTLLGHFDTDHLVRMRREMSLIPGDATTLAHIVAFIRSLISRELANPDRIEADRARVERLAAERKSKAEADLKAKQEAEKAALVPAATSEERAALDAKALDEKHAREQAALARQHVEADLAAKQAEERKAFDAKQAEERQQALADVPDPSAPQWESSRTEPGPYPQPAGPRTGPVFDSPSRR